MTNLLFPAKGVMIVVGWSSVDADVQTKFQLRRLCTLFNTTMEEYDFLEE